MKFQNILSPVTSEDFLQSNWDSSSLILSGVADRFSSLPSISDIPSLLAGTVQNNHWANTHNLTAQAYRTDRNGATEQFQDVPIGMYSQLFNAGYSLCFNDISFAVPELSELVEDVMTMKFSGSGVSVTCYLTPPNSHGSLHFDCQHVFFLQVEGQKKWRIAETKAIENPIHNLVYSKIDQHYLNDLSAKGYVLKTPRECGAQDILLEAGDMLYMPPGFYHLGHTESSNSLHYTLTLEPLSVFNKIFGALHQEFLKHTSALNTDTRFMNETDKTQTVGENIRLIKKVIKDIPAEELASNLDINNE